jgi:magnesium transporter
MDQQDRERLTHRARLCGGQRRRPDEHRHGERAPDVTLGVVLRYLRMRGELPERTDCLFVVDRHDRYLGTLPLTRLLTATRDDLGACLDRDEAAHRRGGAGSGGRALFQDRDLVSAAVVGRRPAAARAHHHRRRASTSIREEAEHPVMLAAAGLRDEEDIFAGVAATRRRSLWLGINLVTAFLAACGRRRNFEGTIEKVARSRR